MNPQTTRPQRGTRGSEILEVLARELENNPGARITTAGLARAVGVSEAALYRHFASKAKMFEGLIGFAEDTVFGRVRRVLEEQAEPAERCRQILYLVLGFAERNPGISRILSGDALLGENERLRGRAGKFFERLETQLKQVLREANLTRAQRPQTSIAGAAALMMAVAEGQIARYVRSGFRDAPTAHWDELWAGLARAVFGPVSLRAHPPGAAPRAVR